MCVCVYVCVFECVAMYHGPCSVSLFFLVINDLFSHYLGRMMRTKRTETQEKRMDSSSVR